MQSEAEFREQLAAAYAKWRFSDGETHESDRRVADALLPLISVREAAAYEAAAQLVPCSLCDGGGSTSEYMAHDCLRLKIRALTPACTDAGSADSQAAFQAAVRDAAKGLREAGDAGRRWAQEHTIHSISEAIASIPLQDGGEKSRCPKCTYSLRQP